MQVAFSKKCLFLQVLTASTPGFLDKSKKTDDLQPKSLDQM